MAVVYVPRSPTTGVLYGVVRAHLAEFLAAVDETDGNGVPGFVVKEFRKFLRCGVLAHGFARVRCGDCTFGRLVPFSCKGRAICPSCGGRRMCERAAHLVDHVLPADVPVRQWVLSVPHRLRYRLAYDHRLCRTVLQLFVRALRSAYRRRARRQGLDGGETGMVTGVQRFGGAVNAHLHFHTLVLDGVFVREPDGTLRFHPASPPTDDDVRGVVGRVRRRLERLGICYDQRRGRRSARGRVGAACRPCAGGELRPGRPRPAPLGQGRLRRLRDGRIAVALQRPWADGTTHLVFTPMELLQRLVPLVPRPRINLLLYHGVFAPNAPWRREVVARADPEASAIEPSPHAPPADEQPVEGKAHRMRPKYRAWADLMRRAFEADVLACPRCGGRMTVLATIEDPAVIHRILTHLGLSVEAEEALPAARGSP